MAAQAEFHMPVRSADIWGLNDGDERDPDDIAADLDFQDRSIEDYLTHELPQVYVQQADLGSGTIEPTQMATGTPGTGKAPVSQGASAPAWTDIALQSELDSEATTRAAADALLFPNNGLRRGTVSYTLNGLDTNTSTTVIFSSQFTSPPVVVVTPSTETQKNLAAALTNVTTAQFVVRVFPTGGLAVGTTTGSVHWHALVP